MSNQVNSELLDRTGDLLDNSLITDSQVSVIKTMVHNNDIEGLYWALPKIERDIADREQKAREQALNEQLDGFDQSDAGREVYDEDFNDWVSRHEPDGEDKY